MKFRSTRNPNPQSEDFATLEQALLRGYAPDGGLYVPERLPRLSPYVLQLWSRLDFPHLAFSVLQLLLTVDGNDNKEISDDALMQICLRAFENFEDPKQALPIKAIGPDTTRLYVAQLHHGPTFCFKDFGLQLVVRMLAHFAEKRQKTTTLLVSTTGDTGPAAVQAVADVDSKFLNIIVHYPDGQISEFQRQQLTTVKSKQVKIVAFQGGGDDMDGPIKNILKSASTDENSAVWITGINSYNIGRPLCQMIHWIWIYLRTVEMAGHPMAGVPSVPQVDCILPVGAMGNLAAAYMVQQMGVPLGYLCGGVNMNDITHRIMETGDIVPAETMVKTLSEAINVQGMPYNFERLLYYVTGGSAQKVQQWMNELAQAGRVSMGPELLQALRRTFYTAKITDDETKETMRWCHANFEQYVVDPHTALAMCCALRLGYPHRGGPSGGQYPSLPVLVATASPCKFKEAVTAALGEQGWQAYEESEQFPNMARDITSIPETPPIKYEIVPSGSHQETQQLWEQKTRELMAELNGTPAPVVAPTATMPAVETSEAFAPSGEFKLGAPPPSTDFSAGVPPPSEQFGAPPVSGELAPPSQEFNSASGAFESGAFSVAGGGSMELPSPAEASSEFGAGAAPASGAFSMAAPPASKELELPSPVEASSEFGAAAAPASGAFSVAAPPASTELDLPSPTEASAAPRSGAFSMAAPDASKELELPSPAEASSEFGAAAAPASGAFSMVAPPASKELELPSPAEASSEFGAAAPASGAFSMSAPPASKELELPSPAEASAEFGAGVTPASGAFSMAPPQASQELELPSPEEVQPSAEFGVPPPPADVSAPPAQDRPPAPMNPTEFSAAATAHATPEVKPKQISGGNFSSLMKMAKGSEGDEGALPEPRNLEPGLPEASSESKPMDLPAPGAAGTMAPVQEPTPGAFAGMAPAPAAASATELPAPDAFTGMTLKPGDGDLPAPDAFAGMAAAPSGGSDRPAPDAFAGMAPAPTGAPTSFGVMAPPPAGESPTADAFAGMAPAPMSSGPTGGGDLPAPDAFAGMDPASTHSDLPAPDAFAGLDPAPVPPGPAAADAFAGMAPAPAPPGPTGSDLPASDAFAGMAPAPSGELPSPSSFGAMASTPAAAPDAFAGMAPAPMSSGTAGDSELPAPDAFAGMDSSPVIAAAPSDYSENIEVTGPASVKAFTAQFDKPENQVLMPDKSIEPKKFVPPKKSPPSQPTTSTELPAPMDLPPPNSEATGGQPAPVLGTTTPDDATKPKRSEFSSLMRMALPPQELNALNKAADVADESNQDKAPPASPMADSNNPNKAPEPVVSLELGDAPEDPIIHNEQE